MSRPSQIFILAEDQRQKQLIYRFLARAGVRPHQVIFELSPSGRGSAEQWVRENFVRQARKCRARQARAATGMFVMQDADVLTVQERLNALDEALASAGQPPVSREHDSIARLIPKRNVETWIHFLSTTGVAASPVDEELDYKRTRTPDEWSVLVSPAAEVLFAWTRPAAELPENLIDSLRLGLQEIPHALPVGR
jgi:hypothetical protein